ncbi:MAG: hypothetical protein AB9891_16840 [Anaerolineaceae bacterium]
MNHQAILKRAWNILFSYKTLWVFGIILALTTASSSGGGGGSSNQRNNNGNNFNFPSDQIPGLQSQLSRISHDLTEAWNELTNDVMASNGANLPWEIIIPVAVFLFLLGIGFTIVRQVSRVSLIRMVNGYEVSGEKLTWKQGLSLGWSRAAWRIFLIDLLLGIVVMIGVVVAMGCIAVPFLLGGGFSEHDMALGAIIAAIGLFFLFIFAAILLAVSISLVLEPVYRACVLENLGVMESFSRGWKLVRANLKDIFLMWIILIGIQIVYSILLIPIALIVGGIGLLIGGGLGVAVYFLTSAGMSGDMTWIPAAVVGGTIFLLVFGLPMTFVEGLKETYLSTTWTLTYRELKPSVSMSGESSITPEAHSG